MYEITNFHYFITIIIILFDASPVVKELLRLCSKAFRVELMIRHQELAFAMSKGIEHDERVPRRLGMFFISFECGIYPNEKFYQRNAHQILERGTHSDFTKLN